MSQNRPSLTVIIPNYNHGHLIGEQLGSVFAQSVPPTKVIIIDDASTDGSRLILEGLASSKKNVALIFKEKNTGVNAVMNEALRVADTDYVAFLAADDITLPQFFEKSLGLLARFPEAAICSGVCYVRYSHGDYVVPNWVRVPCSAAAYLSPDQVTRTLLRNEGWFMGCTTIYRRQPLLEAGGFDINLLSYADGFVSRVLALRHGACFIPEPLAIWRRSDAGYASSTTRDEEAYERILVNVKNRMATDLAGVFSANLAKRDNSRMLFRVLCKKVDAFEVRLRAAVEVAQPIGRAGLILLAAHSMNWVLKLILFAALRFRDIPRTALSQLVQLIPPRVPRSLS